MFKRIRLFFICASLFLAVHSTASPVPVWSFHDGYIEKSGTALLHTLEVNLPHCSVGNICEQDAPFSVYIASATPQNAHTYSFFAEDKDVTTLFYYDAAGGFFKVKPHYEQAFFANFTPAGKTGVFKYLSMSGASGEVAILIANKTLKGKLRYADGGAPQNLAGFKVLLSYAGSDSVPPHTIAALIDENGEYEVRPLAFFDYEISLDFPSKITANATEDPHVLAVTHIIPKFDFLFTLEESPWGFTLFTPAALNPALTGGIKSFAQLSGAPAHTRIAQDRAALLFLETDSAPYVFLGEMRTGAAFMLITPPIKRTSYSYTYFSLFSKEGVYARIKMIGGAFASALKQTPLSISLESPVKTSASTVKVHLYNSEGKAEDVTRLFNFNEELQTLTANKGYSEVLFEKLRREAGTLSATFCEDKRDSGCFRIKREILPAGGVLRVKTTLRPQKEKRFFVTLSRLNFSENEYSRVLPLDHKGEALFEDLPAGEYQLLLSDLELVYSGEAFPAITREDSLTHGVKAISLPLKKTDKYTDYDYKGSLREAGTVHLRREEYKTLDLNSLNISSPLEERILGQPPVGFEYLINEGSLALLAPHFAKDARFALLFSSRGVIYKLNIFYEGYHRPQIKKAGQDFAMCPRERPYCEDAFVDVRGAKDGLYDGRFPLTLIFPEDLKARRVTLENTDITEMFDFTPSQSKLSLKRSAIPTFLSLLAKGNVLKIELGGEPQERAAYYLNMAAAYKSAELSVVDDLGGQSALFSGLKVALLGLYGEGGEIFKTAVIKGDRAVFEELPDGEYRAVLADGKGNYAGETEFLLSAGLNRARPIFRVSCVGDSSEYMERCVPIIPLIAGNRLRAPEAGMVFIDSYGIKFSSAEVAPPLKARLLRRALVLFAERAGDVRKNQVVLKGASRRVLAFDVDNASTDYVRVVVKPKKEAEEGSCEVFGVNNSFVYNGRAPLAFKFNTPNLYDKDELRIVREEGLRDVTGMFIWDKHALTLKEEELVNFTELLEGRQQLFSISMAEGDKERGYRFLVLIGGGAADVTVELTGAPVKDALALLMGKSDKNGYEYRQLVNVKGRRAVFKDVPKGIYEAVVFDLAAASLGSAELSVSGRESDLYLEVEIKKIND